MTDFLFFDFNEKSSVLLIFFAAGLIFSFLSYQLGAQRENKASKWLSLLLFLCAMYITPHMTGYAGWYSVKATRHFLYFIPFMQVFLIGPVVYFYTKTLLNGDYKLTSVDYYHFLPAALYSVYNLVVFVTDKLILDEFYFYADGRDKDLANWYQATGLISMTLYLLLSLRFYSTYKKLVYQEVSYAESILFKWVRNFMWAFLGLILLRVLFFIFNPNWGQFGSQFWYYLSFSCVFTYVAIMGYSHLKEYTSITEAGLKVYNVFTENHHSSYVEVYNAPIDDDKLQSSPSLATKTAEKNNSLSEEELDHWKDMVQSLMLDERLFENPRLTLADLAEGLNTNTKLISTVVNRGFQMNFNDYVNQFRIDAVKNKILEGEHLKQTLLGVALESGFNSKATFNRAFRKITAQSPKEYIDTLA